MNKKISWRKAALLSSGALIGSAAQAQQAEPQDTLEEVIVTAQFRSENLQETPLAITAITGDMLEARSQTSIYEVAAQSPNVTLAPQNQANGSGLVAFIRGVGQIDFNFALEPGVGLYIDDVYYSTLTGSLVDLLDVDRVEVLRGPQGTLAGRNSIGGAVKMFSKKPEGEGGYVSLAYGSYNRVDVRASGDFTLSPDKLYMRVAGVSKNRDGYIDIHDYGCTHPNSGVGTLKLSDGCGLGTLGGMAYTAGRLSLRWLPSDSVEVNLIADITNDESEAGADTLKWANQVQPSTDPRYVTVDDNNPATPLVPLDCRFIPYGNNSCDSARPNNPYLTYATFVDTRAPVPQRPFKPVVVPPVQELDQYGFSANVDWNISDSSSLKWISSWRKYDSSWAQDVDNSPAASQQLLQTITHWQWSQELRFNGSMGDALDYTVGGFYFKQDGTLQARVDLNYAGIDFVHGPDPTPSDSAAAFVHTVWHAGDSLDVSAGVRYTQDSKDYTYHRHNPDGSLPAPCTGFPFAPTQPPNCVLAGLNGAQGHFEGDQLDWRLAVDFSFSDDVMAYGSVATGYKGGGINPRPFFLTQVLPFDPETLLTYEVGFKADLLDNRMRVNMAAFFNDYQDIILTLSACPTAPCLLPANVGAADVQGVELETEWKIGSGWSLDLAASWLDFEYTDTNPAVTGITLDMITPFTPEIKASAGLQWQGDKFSARMDWSYQSEMFGLAINKPQNQIPAYGVGNLRLGWTPNDDWQTTVEVLNVTDKLYYLAVNEYYASAGTSSYGPALPRTWAITVKRSFD